MEFLNFLLIAMLISAPTLIILVPLFWRAQERRQVFGIVDKAMERDGSVPVDLLATIRRGLRQGPSKSQDLRRGMFLLALALALGAIGFTVYSAIHGMYPNNDDPKILGVIVGSLGIIPGFIGLAYVILSRTARSEG